MKRKPERWHVDYEHNGMWFAKWRMQEFLNHTVQAQSNQHKHQTQRRHTFSLGDDLQSQKPETLKYRAVLENGTQSPTMSEASYTVHIRLTPGCPQSIPQATVALPSAVQNDLYSILWPFVTYVNPHA